MFVSPTEPPLLRALGTTSSLPERYGADVLFRSEVIGWVGVQRKTFPDLLASLSDGRMPRVVTAMRELDVSVLLVEGEPAWSPEGRVAIDDAERPVTSWTREQYRSLLWSVRAEGIWVDFSDDLPGTVTLIRSLQRWAAKTGHEALVRRPGPRRGLSRQDAAVHLLQGLPRVGPRLARRIVEHFDGLPIRWRVSVDELAGVRGLGPVSAQRLWDALDGVGGDGDEDASAD